MEKLTLEEIGQILDQHTNEEIYMNEPVTLDDGTVVGLEDLQNRYTELLKQQQNSIPLFDRLTEEELEKILNQHIKEEISMNVSVSLDDGTIVGLQQVQNRYNELRRQRGIFDNNQPLGIEKDNNSNINNLISNSNINLNNKNDMNKMENNNNNNNNNNFKPMDINEIKNNNNNNIDFEKMSVEELLERYALNKEKINNYNFGKLNLNQLDYLILENEQKIIKEVIKQKLNLIEELGQMSDEQLVGLRNQIIIQAANLNQNDLDLKDKLRQKAKIIINEIEYRRLIKKIKKQMADIINNITDSNGNIIETNLVDIKDIDTINPNDTKYQLNDDEIEAFLREKYKLNLLKELGKNRTKVSEQKTDENKDNTKDKENIPQLTKNPDPIPPRPTPIPEPIHTEIPVPPLPTPTPKPTIQPELTDLPKKTEVIVSFMNNSRAIKGYFDLKVPVGTTIHGPVIDPVPLNKKGKPKKITAKVFDCWVDQYGNKVDLSQPITENMILSAQFKFDKKKAVAVGLGAAVGTAAFIADTAIPIPTPVVSTIGSVGLGVAARLKGRNLKNIQLKNEAEASKITAFDPIPEDLQNEIERAKKSGYVHTFLTSAHIACVISSSAQGIKRLLDKPDHVPEIPDSTSISEPLGTEAPIPPISSPTPISPEPISSEPIQQFDPSKMIDKVFKTAKDAMSGSNGLNPYQPAFTGNETFEAVYNNTRIPIGKGQSIAEIAETLGADPSQIAVNVMNEDGIPLTWEKLTDLVGEGVVQGAKFVK